MKKIVFGAFLVSTLVFATACMDSGTTDEDTDDTSDDTGSTAQSEFEIEATEYAFSIEELDGIEPGEQVTLVVKNEGEMTHDLVFEDLDVGTEILQPGEEEAITFTAPEAGTYTFYCSVAGHRSMGMEGTMTVE